MTTPGFPVRRPYISAMIEPTCSWRTRTVWISFESWSASKMRPVSPPGMPKTNSMPASSRTRTTAWGTSISSGIMCTLRLSLRPELSGGQTRALGHRLELGPRDLGLDLVDGAREGREATIGSRDHALPADDLRVPDEALRDQLRMLDEVGRRVQHARNDHPVVRQALSQRDIAVMRPFVVSPAEVESDTVSRNITQRMVERLDVGLRDLQELGVAQIGEREMAPHGKVGAVHLQHEPG